MTKTFGQLTAPNYSARVSFADVTAYFAGGFLLTLPILPFPKIQLYFAVFTLIWYSLVIIGLFTFSFVSQIKSARLEIWQIQFLGVKMLVSEAS